MLSVVFAECHMKTFHAECRCAECRYAECRRALSLQLLWPKWMAGTNLFSREESFCVRDWKKCLTIQSET